MRFIRSLFVFSSLFFLVVILGTCGGYDLVNQSPRENTNLIPDSSPPPSPPLPPSDTGSALNIYIDASFGDGGDGSQGSPYNEFRDINWTSGGDSSITDWVSDGYAVYINLKRGDIWRETLTVGASGAPGRPITIQAYGIGNAPIISGADLVSNWTVHTKIVWRAIVNTEPKQIFLDGARSTKDATSCPNNLDTDKEWCWTGNKLYLYSTSDPDTQFTSPGVEASVRTINVNINGKDYITFEDITSKMANSNGFQSESSSNITFTRSTGSYNWDMGISMWGTSGDRSTDITIDTCTADHNGQNGIYIGDYSNGVLVTTSTLHHNGQNPNDIFNGGFYAANTIGTPGVSYGIILEYNTAYSNGKDDFETVIAGSNGGFGLWFDTLGDNSGSDPVIMRYNNSYENAHSGLFIENTDGGQMYYNLSHDNDDYGLYISCSNKNAPAQNNVVYNNVAYGNNMGIVNYGAYQETTTHTTINNLFKNNISTNNTTYELDVANGGQNVSDANGRGIGNVYTYNALGTESSNFIRWGFGSTHSTYDSWETASGNCGSNGCSNSVESDPLMTDPANDDFTLQSNSPCKDVGTNVSLYSDYVGLTVPYNSIPDIGAYEW
jgi:hypothetical protein